MAKESANFNFLQAHDIQLVRLGALAERYFRDDPNTCLIKLRQFAELLAQLTAAKTGLFESADETQAILLRRLKLERIISPEVADLFHHIRVVGNQATHQYKGNHEAALTTLKMARHLGIWFHRTFGGDRRFKPGAFVPPPNPVDATAALATELARLQTTQGSIFPFFLSWNFLDAEDYSAACLTDSRLDSNNNPKNSYSGGISMQFKVLMIESRSASTSLR
jgi:type I restriction enzyme, R subunit